MIGRILGVLAMCFGVAIHQEEGRDQSTCLRDGSLSVGNTVKGVTDATTNATVSNKLKASVPSGTARYWHEFSLSYLSCPFFEY